jgi:hypothetical protein
MGDEERNQPVAGWYEDPSGQPGRRRYWDGAQWTDRYSGGGSPRRVEDIDREFPVLYRVAGVLHALGWIVLVLGLIGVLVGAISAGSEDQALVRDAFGNLHRNEPGANAAGIAIIGTLAVLFYSLLLFAGAAAIRLALRVEDNTFRTAAAVELLLERTPARPGT